MAIQGIITGFADRHLPAHHVILVGRGSGYSLIRDGELQPGTKCDLESAYAAFWDKAAQCLGTWLEVRGTSTSGETGRTSVTEFGTLLLDEGRQLLCEHEASPPGGRNYSLVHSEREAQ